MFVLSILYVYNRYFICLGRDEVCRYLIKLELPTATYTHSGVNTIQCIIENGKNDIGKLALQQFRAGERSSGNRYFYLSSLGKKRGRSILKAKANNSSLLGSKAPTALQVGHISFHKNIKMTNKKTSIATCCFRLETPHLWSLNVNAFF